MGHLQTQGSMELVCIDFLCLEPNLSGQENVLVVTNHYFYLNVFTLIKGQTLKVN